VKRYVEEAGATAMRALFGSSVPATSRIAFAEVAAAIARRTREGDIDPADRDRLLERLAADAGAMLIVEVAREVVERAMRLVVEEPLRGADAVHLASAVLLARGIPGRMRFACADRTLSAAAARKGLDPIAPGEP
jgi:predicted nucleic acid-binding protein